MAIERRQQTYAIVDPRELSLVFDTLFRQPEKTAQAVTALVHVLQRRAISPDELREVQVALADDMRSNAIEPREVADAVDRWHMWGLPADPRPQWSTRIRELNLATIEALAQRFREQPAIVSLVGDSSRFDVEQLARDLGARLVRVTRNELANWGD